MAISILFLIVLIRFLLKYVFNLPEDASATIMSIGQLVAEAVGAIMIILQLSRESDAGEQQALIQEAQFIHQYNQSFIQDENMTYVEQCLERSMKSGGKIEIVNDENLQKFINYLVYLEGMAPLILNNVLQLKHVDDLMAYRFFLAINNEELQRKELLVFPEYYKGCFKLYSVWKKYRRVNRSEILLEEQSLDKWLVFEKYIDSDTSIRDAQVEDLPKISEVLFHTDPFIYPTAFRNIKKAKKHFPLIMKDPGSAYYYKNIKVAVSSSGMIVGAICYYNTLSRDYDYYSALKLNSDQAKHVCEHYFAHLSQYSEDINHYYIVALIVINNYRQTGVGKMLLKSVLLETYDKTVSLDVLCDNHAAISLYKSCDFHINGKAYKGYSYPPEENPDCYSMIRQPSNKWIIPPITKRGE